MKFLGKGYNPMWGILNQVPNRGSINSSHTVIGREGVADATAWLSDEMFQMVDARPGDRSYLEAMDRLHPRRLSQDCLVAVLGLPFFEDTALLQEQLEARLRLLKDVVAANATRDSRDVRDAVEAVVGERVTDVRESLARSFDSRPGNIGGVTRDCQDRLREFPAPRTGTQHITRLNRVLRSLQELPQYESWLVPEAYERVIAALLQQSRDAAEQALGEVIERESWDAFRKQAPTIQAVLKEMDQRGSRYREQRDQVLQRMADHRHMIRAQQEGLVSSVSLPLPSPDTEQIISGMKTATGCGDVPALVERLTADFDARLRECAATTCPHVDLRTASFATLVLEIPAEELAEQLERLVESQLGPGHSLYQLADNFGLELCVEFLWERSASTCFFGGRDEDKLGLSTTWLVILRLPRATNAEDEQIRTRLKNLFLQRYEHCHVDEGSERDHEISLTRINAGWIIGIEQANHALLQRYAVAADENHLPHLIGIVADAPDGGASTAYLRLARTLAPIEEIIEPPGEDVAERQLPGARINGESETNEDGTQSNSHAAP